MNSRVIRKAQQHSSSEVRELVAAIFSAELIAPGKCLWLVSPWISDVNIIDNSAASYEPLLPWGRRSITLSELLASLARRGTTIVIGTTTDQHNTRFLSRLKQLMSDANCDDRLVLDIDESELLHTKALTGDGYALFGSMNFTYNGIELREEHIEFRTDPEYVAQARLEAMDRFGGVL